MPQKQPTITRHFNRLYNRRRISKWETTNGMILELNYKAQNIQDPKPLIFVIDTDEYNPVRRMKKISGVNLNYLNETIIEEFFQQILKYTAWVRDDLTKSLKIDVRDEEAPSTFRPKILYQNIVKSKLLSRYDCYRSYLYDNLASVYDVNYKFKRYPLSELSNPNFYEKNTQHHFLDKAVLMGNTAKGTSGKGGMSKKSLPKKISKTRKAVEKKNTANKDPFKVLGPEKEVKKTRL